MTASEWADFLSKGTSQAFPNVKRSDVVSGLKDRLTEPKKISQKNTSLCGAASLMFCLARLKDEMYAQYISDLYMNGTGWIGKLKVQPGDDCKKYSPSTSSGIHPVDWVALASLRDSENDAFDYDSPSCETGGITMPEDLLDWFKQAGFSKDSNVTNLVFTKGKKEIEDASTKFTHDQSVCLFINSNMLTDPSSRSAIPTHWIVLQSAVTIAGGNITFDYYSWGKIDTLDISFDDFGKNFYGYIASSSK